MEVPLLGQSDETEPGISKKHSSQVVLPQTEYATLLKQPGGFRRQFLLEQAAKRGIPYKVGPSWSMPFIKALEELGLAGIADLVGGDYEMTVGSSAFVTYFSLFKSMLTTGVLFIPGGFLQGGWCFSLVSVALMACVCTLCMGWLSEARDRHRGSYSELSGLALGKPGYYLVEFAIFTTQMGFVVVGGVFFNRNLLNTLEFFGVSLGLWTAGLVQFLLTLPMIFYRKITDLTMTHIVADLIIFVNIVYILGSIGAQLVTQGSPGEGVQAINTDSCIIMFGMSVYMFEGIGLVLPIKQSMKEPRKFNLVLVAMMVSVSSILLLIGTAGYLTYGNNTQQVVSLNIGQTTVGATLMLGYMLAVVVTHPLTLFPSYTILDAWLGKRVNVAGSTVLRVIVLALLLAAAVLLNDRADKYISLLGSLLCALLGYVMPSLIYLKLTPGLKAYSKILPTFFIALGVFGGILTFTTVILKWNSAA